MAKIINNDFEFKTQIESIREIRGTWARMVGNGEKFFDTCNDLIFDG